jgi:2-dehydropantoate 2-reductase
MIETSILVVGAGAIGGVTAAKMTGEVRRVVVLDAHADLAGLDDPFDFALITLKAPHLRSALGPLLDRGLVETFVSLGNGLVQERIAGIVGDGNLIWGAVEWGATNLGPGRLARTTRGPFVIGEPDGSVGERTRLLAEALGTVDGARVTENIRGQVWSKLLVNSAFSGLGAVAGLLYREVVADPDGKEVALALWREGYDVGMAQNLELEDVLGVPADALVVGSPKDRERAEEALDIAMRQAGATKASMLQDLERGTKTEVDVINGGVVEKGREYGVQTPLNSRVVELVHAMERGERRPGRDVFGELRELA